MKSPLKITYVGHSGFLAEGERASFLFDYESGELPVNREKPLLVFVSHRHWDHFGKELFRRCESFPDTRYILSKDIKLGPRRRAIMGVTEDVLARIIWIGPEETAEVAGVTIRTLRSTDQGVAFLLHWNDRALYHAGDLNWWLWAAEDSPAEAEEMTRRFLAYTKSLEGEQVDAAFLPLDPRQSPEQFWLGLDWYARHMEIDHIFPMHFWKDYDAIARLKALPQAAPYLGKIMDITEEGQSYDL